MRKFFAIFVGTAVLTLGSCNVDSWNLGLGSGSGNDVGFVFENGLELTVPVL